MPDTSVPMDYADAIKKAADATAQLKTQWDSPAFRQQSRQLAVARVEYERTVTALQRINQQETIRARTMDMQRRMGKFGAAVVGAGMAIGSNAAVQGAWALAHRGANYAQGMAQRGFGGTVEAARMGNEMTMLAREFAGVAKPFTDGLEKLTRSVRRAMETMDGDQQRRMLYGAGAVLAGGLAYRMRGTIGAGVGAVGSMFRGGIGNVLGKAGIAGMAFGTARILSGYGTTAADETNPYTKTFAEQHPEMAKKLDKMTPQQLRDAWNKTKDEGSPNVIRAGAHNLSMGIVNAGKWVLNQIPIGERMKYEDVYSPYDQLKRELQRRQAIGTREGRKMVTLPGGGIEEAGAGYFRMQQSFGAKQNAENQESGGPEDLLTRIAKAVEKMAGVEEVK